MSKYGKWYIIGKLFCSTFRICKQIWKFAKIEFFIAKSSFMIKMFAKKNNLIFNEEKLKMCKFSLTGCLQKICIFFAKLVQFVSFLCQRLYKKLNFIKIWQVEVGQNKDLVCYMKKQSFRQCARELRQLVLKPGFRPKGRALGM